MARLARPAALVRPPARAAAGAAALLGAAAVAHAAPGITALGPVRRRCFPSLAGVGAADHVALTFDDGPDPGSTPRFADLLAARGVRATFFLLGSMVQRAPGLAAELAAAGHQTAVHGWDHRNMLLRGPRAVYDDMARARDAVADATGTVPGLFRPPYGVLTSAAVRAARRLGMRPLLWTCWGRDWTAEATPDVVFATLRRDLTGGATVLLHDSDCTSAPQSWRSALGALEMLLDECDRNGWRAGPVNEH